MDSHSRLPPPSLAQPLSALADRDLRGLHAEHIGFREFWRFAWRERHRLLRYLRWTDRMRARQLVASKNALHGD